jgi:hypothetical protein
MYALYLRETGWDLRTHDDFDEFRARQGCIY